MKPLCLLALLCAVSCREKPKPPQFCFQPAQLKQAGSDGRAE